MSSTETVKSPADVEPFSPRYWKSWSRKIRWINVVGWAWWRRLTSFSGWRSSRFSSCQHFRPTTVGPSTSIFSPLIFFCVFFSFTHLECDILLCFPKISFFCFFPSCGNFLTSKIRLCFLFRYLLPSSFLLSVVSSHYPYSFNCEFLFLYSFIFHSISLCHFFLFWLSDYKCVRSYKCVPDEQKFNPTAWWGCQKWRSSLVS